MFFETQPVIGLISGTNFSSEREFQYYFENRAKVVTQEIVPNKFSFDDFDYAINEIPSAARKLMALQPAVFAFSSISITCMHGRKIVNRLEQTFGIPALVSAQASVDALLAVGCHRIAVLSPLSAALNLVERCFFERHGIEIVRFLNLFDLQNEDTTITTNISADQVLSALSGDFSEIDGIFFDSPTFPPSFELPDFTSITHLPVLSSNQALAQAVERRLDLH